MVESRLWSALCLDKNDFFFNSLVANFITNRKTVFFLLSVAVKLALNLSEGMLQELNGGL